VGSHKFNPDYFSKSRKDISTMEKDDLKDFSKDLSNTVSEAYLVGLFPGFLDSDF
jgi:hypothetical protein